MKSIFCRCDCSFVYWLVCSFVRTIAFKKFTLCLCLNCIPFWLDLISFWFYSLSFERFLLMFSEFVFIYWWFSLSTEWEFEKVNLLTEGQTTALKQQQMMDLCKASESMRSGKVFQYIGRLYTSVTIEEYFLMKEPRTIILYKLC